DRPSVLDDWHGLVGAGRGLTRQPGRRGFVEPRINPGRWRVVTYLRPDSPVAARAACDGLGCFLTTIFADGFRLANVRIEFLVRLANSAYHACHVDRGPRAPYPAFHHPSHIRYTNILGAQCVSHWRYAFAGYHARTFFRGLGWISSNRKLVPRTRRGAPCCRL